MEESVCVSTGEGGAVSRVIANKPVYVVEIAPVGFFPRSPSVSHIDLLSLPFFKAARFLCFPFANHRVAKRGHPVK